jgi:CzcA family heavy metal efflux pump
MSDWLQAHRRSILFFLALLVIGGGMAALNLPVSLFPSVDFPRVVVSVDAGDRPAEQMELEVMRPVEEAIQRVPGVLNIRSKVSRGTADVSINFDWGHDMPQAALQIAQAMTQLLPQLPQGTTIETRRMDPTVFPIMAYSLTSDQASPAQLHDLAQYTLRPLLAGIPGVARVDVVGGAQDEFQAIVDPAQLAAYDLSLADVSNALSASNVVQAVGRLEDHYKLYLAVADTRFRNLGEIRQTVIKTGDNGKLVRLEDVARVIKGVTPQWIRVTADGHDAVLVNIYQQPGSNSVQLAKDVHARLEQAQDQLPAGVKLASWYDQSELVVASAASVRDAILIGVLLAALVLWLFLRNGKITLIAILVVPAALAATVVLLQALNMSFNIMTLGGMAAAVGLIIDDAIVMTEHIVRRLHGSGGDHHGRVMAAAREFSQPLIGSSASTIIIFLPLAFLTGVTGAFFKALSLTMAASLILSFLITWLAVPLLADKFLGEKDAVEKPDGRMMRWLHTRYSALLPRLVLRPLLLLVGLVPLLALGLLAYVNVGSGFMPVMDEGGFILDYRSAPGTSLTETDRLLRQVEKIIRDDPSVSTYSRRTGAQLGGGLTEANEGDFFIRLKNGSRPPIDQVMDDIRGKVEAQVPGLNIELLQLLEDVIGDLTAVPQPIEVKLYSDQPKQLDAAAGKIAAAIRAIPGVVDVNNGIVPAGDAMEIRVDRARAALEGVTPDEVTRLLDTAIGGNVTTSVLGDIKMIGVRVWTPAGMRSSEKKLGELQLRASDGHLFPLKRVAEIHAVSGQPQIDRENLKRMVAVTGRISGRDMGSVIADVQKSISAKGMLPAGMRFELGGLYQQQQIAFRGLMLVFAAAIALVFLLLLFLYESFRIALAILAMPLLAVSAVFVGLWVTGLELNISAMMGMTMIVGIVTEVAIFYFSEYRDLVAEDGHSIEALVAAGNNRMRPIAMTTLAAILTLLPLAFAIGQGSAMQQPLAVAIVSGLLVQLPLVLLVMPVIFQWLLVRGGSSADTPGDGAASIG